MDGRQKLITGAKHFYWNEAIKPGHPQPADSLAYARIVDAARHLESVRAYLGGHPIYVTSWYRDARHNAKVGGSPRSRHLFGDAVDFYCRHLTPKEIYQRLDNWHGSKGGLGLYKTHVHLDFRGYRARW